MTHGERAEEFFRQGYNCAQSVLLAFGDITGLEDETALKLSSSFGGGLGRLREVCGAVSGACMALGMIKGYTDPDDREAKKAQYRLVQDFAERARTFIVVKNVNGRFCGCSLFWIRFAAPAMRLYTVCFL